MLPRTTQTLSDAPGTSAGERPSSRRWPMHARGVGQMLDLTVDLFVARALAVVGLAFLMWLPARLLSVMLEGDASGDEILPVAFELLSAVAVQTISVALTIQVIYAELQGRPASLGAILRTSLRRGPALLASTLLISTALWFGYVCLIVPGILLTFLWAAAPAALVLEASGPIACLARSQRLVVGRFLAWAGMFGAMFVLRLSYDSLVGALDTPQFREWGLETVGIPSALLTALRVVLGSLLASVSSAAWSIAVTVFYLDCRTRREGFDLSMRLERLQDDARAAAGRAGDRRAQARPAP